MIDKKRQKPQEKRERGMLEYGRIVWAREINQRTSHLSTVANDKVSTFDEIQIRSMRIVLMVRKGKLINKVHTPRRKRRCSSLDANYQLESPNNKTEKIRKP